MKVRRGEIVLVDYLFSDRSGSKVRPCLVVQNDGNNQRLNDTIVAAITSNTTRAAAVPTQLLIEVATATGKQSGLLFDSAVQCENLVTIDNQLVIRKIGALPATVMSEIDACLKMSLGLT
jgi:mRNA interferase MazF